VQDRTNETKPVTFGPRFYIGILLLTVNQPLGWAALLICNAVALAKKSLFFSCLGFSAYALTWVMMGLGFLLAGPQGLRYSRLLLARGGNWCLRFFKKTT